MLLHALSADANRVGQGRNEMFDQRRLADTRLARDPYDAALASTGKIPDFMKLREGVPATHQRHGLERSDLPGTRFCVRRGGNGGRDEAIASARYRLDETRLPRIVIEQRAQIADHCLRDR